MAFLLERHTGAPASLDPFALFDRPFGDWASMLPFRRGGDEAGGLIRVDETCDDNELVIRAELAGIDPAEDVEITVSDGMLHIEAQRRQEAQTEEKGYIRRELRYGTFVRSLELPEGVSAEDISATYADGILEIHVPRPPAAAAEARTIPITTKR